MGRDTCQLKLYSSMVNQQKAPPGEGECNLQIIQLALHQGINR
ncbi:hypothetical protein [Synechocystis sp. PCC 6803]|nr:hypothetical protein [Synechocystis sp. PCC 6803]